jgi:hypothetical protein
MKAMEQSMSIKLWNIGSTESYMQELHKSEISVSVVSFISNTMG